MIEVEDPDKRFGKEPKQMKCHHCFREMTTRVEDSVRDSGWWFALCCCIFGSWINSLLVCCLPGFRQFTHHCPLCNVLLGTARPKHSAVHIIVITVMILLTIALPMALLIALYANILSNRSFN